MNKCALTIGLIYLPLTIIFWSILPDLLTITIFKSIKKLTSINSSIGKCDWTISLPLIIVYHFTGNSIYVRSSLVVIIIITWHHLWVSKIIWNRTTILSLYYILNLLLWINILIIPIKILIRWWCCAYWWILGCWVSTIIWLLLRLLLCSS